MTLQWKIVPTEPTAKMGIAAIAADGELDPMSFYDVYVAAVGAAPQPPLCIEQLLGLLSRARSSVSYQEGMQQLDSPHRQKFQELLNEIDAALALPPILAA
ncbi:hypothetical protein [Pseudomonas farris]